MGRADRRVLKHMTENGGVLTRSAALAMGMPSATVQEWVEVGHLVAVGRGLYVLPGVLTAERTLLQAAVVALDAVVSHESAARIHGLDGINPTRVTVSVPVRRSNRFADVTVHQLTDVTPEHIMMVNGIPVTDPTRTIIDLAAVVKGKSLAACLDQAVRMGATTYEATAEMLETLARKGKPGVVKLRRVLEPRLGGHIVTESTLESRLLGVIADGGLPTPATQYRPPWLRKVNGRVDLAYVEQEILIEGDSRRWHMTPDAFQLDKTRDNLAQLAGWISLRFTWDDITKRPEKIVAQITQALSMRARAGYPVLVH
jgi:predicted transcriptional regulator of viral defense system